MCCGLYEEACKLSEKIMTGTMKGNLCYWNTKEKNVYYLRRYGNHLRKQSIYESI